ncbi:hypothetical protein GUITHDRAFT_149095 [Guillardia theta CCMP2712]|uniref:Uncharacterized protein n=1 Tax=Guillardia theta (strain CCMP2712) TaxID=905079 RepID=L1I7A9_GUITC|nr:hypothetical protein GUITHDRAFT_149095 [Guillardia theta CCMP2712]EKX31745.1 hypothetical protein GUITHDRAFT_149095 [Guillardia theta CCMP2712]|eukprot:XP_005818725.1 hypothetical protein GUITHDRAFT_149095 [Guillardia theta CCMP2712]
MIVYQATVWIDNTPFNRQFLYDLFGALPGEILDLSKCDRQAVMLCTRHHYTLLVSGFVIAVVWMGLSLVLTSFRIPHITALLWTTYPAIVVYYAFGVSPLCFPMIPTCLLEDLVNVLNFFFPATIQFPDSLQASPGCLSNAHNSTERAACILSCSQQPFDYVSWEAEISWWTCLVSTGLCRSVDSFVTSRPVLNKLTSLHKNLAVKAAIVEGNNMDMIVAQSACATLNIWRIIPLIMILFLVFYAFSVIATFPFFLFNEVIRLAIQSVIMTHTD